MRPSSGGKPRAVVDTNLFVSGTISPIGQPRALLRAGHDERFLLVLSDAHYAELVAVFRRPRLTRRFTILAAELTALLAALAAAPRAIPASGLPVAVRDAKDEKILASALGGNADYLVTGDQDLLVLAGDPRLGKLKIVAVAEFLATLAAADHRAGEGPI